MSMSALQPGLSGVSHSVSLPSAKSRLLVPRQVLHVACHHGNPSQYQKDPTKHEAIETHIQYYFSSLPVHFQHCYTEPFGNFGCFFHDFLDVGFFRPKIRPPEATNHSDGSVRFLCQAVKSMEAGGSKPPAKSRMIRGACIGFFYLSLGNDL